MFTLRELRTEGGFTQKELYKLSGVPMAEISKLENGHLWPKMPTRNKIEAVLGRVDWMNTKSLPNKKSKNKITKQDLETRFLKLVADLPTLDNNDRWNLLAEMKLKINTFMIGQKELIEFDETNWDLIAERLSPMIPKN